MRTTYVCGRTARPAKPLSNVGKTLSQIVVFWSFFLWVLPAAIYRVESVAGFSHFRFANGLWQLVGIIVFCLASILGFSCGMLIAIKGDGTPLPVDCPRQLVIVGPYRYVRNPMAIAGLTQGIAVGLYLGSPTVLLYAGAGILLWNYGVRPWEEKDLVQRFGEDYEHYRAAVWCWTPHLRAYKSPVGSQTVSSDIARS